MAFICNLVAEGCCVYQPTEKNNLSSVNITENQQTFTETPGNVFASPVYVSQENPFFELSFQNNNSSIKMIEHNEKNVGMHCMAHSDTGFELGLKMKLI